MQGFFAQNYSSLILNAEGSITIEDVTVANGATLTIKAGNDINIQGVIVNNSSKLILEADGEVNIISDFDVETGSEYEIK
jgi:hypothetical protein